MNTSDSDDSQTASDFTLPDFDVVADLFVSLGALNSPAELHGMLCGHLCGGNRFSDGDSDSESDANTNTKDNNGWRKNALAFLDLESMNPADLDEQAQEFFDSVYTNTLEQFKSDQFELDLLLPSDETDLDQRISSLGHWCHGFLSGFGSSGISGDTKLSEETTGVLRDFAAFVQINPDDAEDEESEADFMEIVDYVQVAVKTVFLETGVVAGEMNTYSSSSNPPTMH